MSNSYQKELDCVLEVVERASQKILEIYHTNFDVKLKADHSEVTEADLKSNQIIVESLSKNFPEYAILSEENKDNKERLTNDYCWIIDPIDGTKDFVNRTNHFAINIALCYKHEIVLGVIKVPCENICYYAIKGKGAYKIENNQISKIHVSDRKSNLRFITSQFFFVKDPMFDNKIIGKRIVIGSSYKAGYVAEGKGELCVKLDPNSKEWDTAPCEIIVKEAGGIMTDLHGNIRKYNKDDVYNHDGFIIANNIDVLNEFKKNN